MLGFVIRRLLWTIPVVLLATALTFVLVKALPYEPFNSPKLTSTQQSSLRDLYGLDDSFPVQYGTFLKDLVTGHLGVSTKPGATPISETVTTRLPVSMLLGTLAFLFAAVVGITSGILSGLRAGRLTDSGITFLSTIAFALPSFVVATLWVKYFPYYGWDTWSQRIGPVVVLGLSITPYFVRLVRASMIESMQQEYIVTARSKGLPWRSTVTRHALRNSLIPTVVNAGPLFGFTLTGSFIIERIMIVPGIANEFVEAFSQPLDNRLVLVTTVLLSTIIIVMNLVVDVVVGWLDPRIVND